MKEKRIRIALIGAFIVVAFTLYYFALPDPLFNDPYSTVLEDRDGHLLGATIAADGQWLFPELAAVPDKFEEAIILYEDRRFEHHPGVDLISMGRALRQNMEAGKVVSGGSTLSMQVIRLARKGQARTIFEKLI
jgi:penicillin-binding protein 1C